MVSRRVISGVVLLGVLAAAPTFAADGQRRRSGGDSGSDRTEEQGQRTGRAVPRSRVAGPQDARRDQAQQAQVQRQYQAPQVQRPYQAAPQVQAQRQYQAEPQARRQYQAEPQAQRQYQAEPQAQRQYRSDRQYEYRGDRQYDRRDYAVRRDYQRPYYPSYSYPNRGGYGYGYGSGSRTVIVPRYITPRFVTVVPYRPYVYRPSIGIGVHYGSGGSYPYGYTPRGYYDPIVGRPYGGLRITGFSQIAQVFADGYYVGIVNDFDGVFQHLNLEAGPHQIEVREPGLEPIAFDVMVQAGRTITFRADVY